MMQGNTIDTLQVEIRAITGQFKSEIDGVKGKLNELGGEGEQAGSKLGSTFQKIGTAAKVAAAAGIAALTAATLGAAKASWDQVKSVQQASATLGRYYDSADDVTKVQQELIKYAQSDMGVLFNRKDLFQAAGNLAMYGSSAEDVTKQVQILSRGMASGVLSWDEMNAVVGRVVSSGKLSRTEFEMLAKAGYNLDASLANTNVTTEEFFNILDNSIPKDITQDMNNIIPVGIRLQSAFRNVGNAILGVNELQDGFLPGSLGERIILMSQGLTQFANNIAPMVRDAFQFIGDAVGLVVEWLQPLIDYIRNNTVLMEVLKNTLIVVGGILVGALLAGITAVVAAAALLTATIDLLVKAFTFVMNVAMAVWPAIRTVVVGAWTAIQSVWNGVTSFFNGIFNAVKAVATAVAAIIGVLFVGAYSTVTGVWSAVSGFFSGQFNAVRNVTSSVVSAITSFFSSAWSNVRGVWSAASGFFSGVVSGIRGAISGIPSTFGSIFRSAWNQITSIFGNLASWFSNIDLSGAGRKIISSFIDGIKSMVGAAKDAAAGVVQSIRDFFPSSPAKEGPLSGRGYTTYSGQAMMKDFASSIHGQAPLLKRTMDNVMPTFDLPTSSQLRSSLDVSLDAPRLKPVERQHTPIVLQLPDGSQLGNWLIDEINGKAFMANSTVLNI